MFADSTQEMSTTVPTRTPQKDSLRTGEAEVDQFRPHRPELDNSAAAASAVSARSGAEVCRPDEADTEKLRADEARSTDSERGKHGASGFAAGAVAAVHELGLPLE